MKFRTLLLLVPIFLVVSIVNAFPNIKNDTLPQLTPNCPFEINDNEDGWIDDEEREIMEFCWNNKLTTQEEVANIIIGEWELVGHGEGWIPVYSQPCSKVSITASELTVQFESEFFDTTTIHTWEIKEGTNGPYLDITPPVFIGAGFSTISAEYMFSDWTPSDGNMYLYQKSNGGTPITECSTPDSVSTFGSNIEWWGPNFGASLAPALTSNDDLDVFTEVCSNAGSDTLFLGGFEFDPVNFNNSSIHLQITKRKSGSPVTDAYLVATYQGNVISANLADTETEWTDTDSTTTYVLDNSKLIIDSDPIIYDDNSFGFLFATSPSDPFCMNAFINSVMLCVEEDTNTAMLIADAGPDQILSCDLPSVTLGSTNTTSGPSIIYEWSIVFPGMPISNTQFVDVSIVGEYILKVTDTNNGQMAFDTVLVNQNIELPTLSIIASEPLTCTTTSVLIDAFISGGDLSDYIFTWTNSSGDTISNQQTITVSEPGEYTLKVEDTENGCYSTSIIYIDQDVDIPIVDIAIPMPLNPLESIILDASNSTTGSDVSYSWTTANGNIVSDQNTLTPTVDSPGVYCLSIINASNGCEASACVEVLESTSNIIADAGPDQVLTCCVPDVPLGGQTSSMGPEFSYVWTDTNGNIISTELFINATVPGTYILSVINTQTQEFDFDEVLVIENLNIPNVTIALPDLLTCDNNAVEIDATSAVNGGEQLTYLWSTMDGNIVSDPTLEDITVDEPGIYTLTVTDESNCCLISETVQINSEAFTIEFFTQDVSCFGLADGAVDINVNGGTAPYEYQFIDSIFGTSGLAAGSYSLTVTDSNNCSQEASFVITQPDELIAEITVLAGDSLLVANPTGGVLPYTYEWNTGSNNSSIVVDLSTELAYSVTITDANGCTSNQEVIFESTSIFNLNSTPINVYPNPTSGQIIIEQTNISQELNSIQVYNLLGETIPFEHTLNDRDAISLNLNTSIQGTYFLIIDLDGKLYHQKIILF